MWLFVADTGGRERRGRDTHADSESNESLSEHAAVGCLAHCQRLALLHIAFSIVSMFVLEAGRRTENGGGTGSSPPFSVHVFNVEQRWQQ